MRVIKTAVNTVAIQFAMAQVAAGAVDKTSPWTFTKDDADKFVKDTAANWYLGTDRLAEDVCLMYPVGKNGKVYRSALLAVRQLAAKKFDESVYMAAGAIIDRIDGKEAKLTKTAGMRQVAWAKFELTKLYDAKDATPADNLDPALGDMNIVEGMASTPNPDRMEDIVEPDGCSYELPIPYLWQHNAYSPIGNVIKAVVSKKGIWSRSAVPKVGVPGQLKDRIDLAMQSIALKLVRGQSIGFSPLEYSYMSDTGGYHFLRWSWYELSAVTIPANIEATIENIKSLDIAAIRKRHGIKSGAPIVRLGGINSVRISGNRVERKRLGQQIFDSNSESIDEILAAREEMLRE
jgi:hypothetical protein